MSQPGAGSCVSKPPGHWCDLRQCCPATASTNIVATAAAAHVPLQFAEHRGEMAALWTPSSRPGSFPRRQACHIKVLQFLTYGVGAWHPQPQVPLRLPSLSLRSSRQVAVSSRRSLTSLPVDVDLVDRFEVQIAMPQDMDAPTLNLPTAKSSVRPSTTRPTLSGLPAPVPRLSKAPLAQFQHLFLNLVRRRAHLRPR